MRTLHLACLLAAAGLATPAAAQTYKYPPGVAASIHDEPRDGMGDTIDFGIFKGLIRMQSTREDRAIHEYDVTSISGKPISQATLSGRVSVNNAYDNGVRKFDFLVYDGNGVGEITDFQITATVVGTGQYHPPNDTYFDYSIDATGVVNTLISGGATWIGLRVQCTTEPNFPNLLSDTQGELEVTLASSVGTPYCFCNIGNPSGNVAPCGNENDGTVPLGGCQHDDSLAGAHLDATGVPSIASDTLVLHGTRGPIANSTLFFQANNNLDGTDSYLGDGIRCAGGGLIRLQVRTTTAGAASTTIGISAKAGVSAGETKYYQWWIRDPSGSPCGSESNTSNGLEITWGA